MAGAKSSSVVSLAFVVIATANSLAVAEIAKEKPLLPEAKWISEGADTAAVLTRLPGECLKPATTQDERYLTELGRAAFRSPFLLGGQAARLGLSCNACHLDGQDNPHFFLEGLSDRAGAADVTSSVFSKVREDEVFNPVPIPNLVGVGQKESFGTATPAETLHDFVEGAVVDEFQGEVRASIIEAVAFYVSRLEPAHCPADARQASALQTLGDVERVLEAMQMSFRRNRAEEIDFLLLSAQHQLGLINARFAGPGLEEERQAITKMAKRLGELRNELNIDASNQEVGFEALLRDLAALGYFIGNAEQRSLYNEEILRERLGAD